MQKLCIDSDYMAWIGNRRPRSRRAKRAWCGNCGKVVATYTDRMGVERYIAHDMSGDTIEHLVPTRVRRATGRVPVTVEVAQ